MGAIFEVLSNTMKIYPGVQLEKMHRMADFAKWGFPIAKAMGGEW